MQISIVPPVGPVLPPMPPGVERPGAYEPSSTPASTPPLTTEAADVAQTVVALDDGGVAIGLDPDDDLSVAPRWLAWMEWVDERQPVLVAAGAAAPATR
jgi:hypothetical protein